MEGEVVGVAGAVVSVEREEDVGEEEVDCCGDYGGEDEGLCGWSVLVAATVEMWWGVYLEDIEESHAGVRTCPSLSSSLVRALLSTQKD